MCMSGPKVTPPAERQAMKLPDMANTKDITDDVARRRRALAQSAFTGSLGLSSGPSTTTVLGG